MIRAALCLVAAPVAALVAGCSVVELTIDEDLDLERCDAFVTGETTLAEVLDTLGPPIELGTRGPSVALLYESVRLREKQLGLSLGELLGGGGWEYLKFSYGSSGTQRRAALFLFDEDQVLEELGTLRFEEPFGRSGSLQVIIAVDEVVSTGGLRASPDAFADARELLNGIQWSQNATHTALVELRGVRNRMGQHALDPDPQWGGDPAE